MNDSLPTNDKSDRNLNTARSKSKFSLVSSPYFILFLAPVFWGGNIIVAKLAVGQIDPVTLVVLRWLGAVLFITPFAWPYVRRDWPLIRPKLIPLLAFGALGYAVFNLLTYAAAQHTSAVNMSIEQASIPVFVFVANLVFFSVRPKKLQVVGLGLTIIGVVWVATRGQPAQLLALDINIGDAMIVLACLLYAFYSILLRFRPAIHWLSFIFIAASGALIAAVLFQLIFGGGLPTLATSIPQITTTGWICVAYVMVFPSIIAQLCFVRGVEFVGANRASVFINLIPVIGTLMSVLILGETFSAYHVIASVLVILGIFLSEYAVRANAKN